MISGISFITLHECNANVMPEILEHQATMHADSLLELGPGGRVYLWSTQMDYMAMSSHSRPARVTGGNSKGSWSAEIFRMICFLLPGFCLFVCFCYIL